MIDLDKIRDNYSRRPLLAEPEIPALCDEIERLRDVLEDVVSDLELIAKLQNMHYADDWQSVALHAEQLARDAIVKTGIRDAGHH